MSYLRSGVRWFRTLSTSVSSWKDRHHHIPGDGLSPAARAQPAFQPRLSAQRRHFRTHKDQSNAPPLSSSHETRGECVPLAPGGKLRNMKAYKSGNAGCTRREGGEGVLVQQLCRRAREQPSGLRRAGGGSRRGVSGSEWQTSRLV